MSTFEMVIDNANLQIHCNDPDEPDHPDIELDLPAMVSTDASSLVNTLYTRGGSTINARTTSIDIQCYGNGPGAPTTYSGGAASFFPDAGAVPDGYVMSEAGIVVSARVSSDEAAVPADWSDQGPPPTRSPFFSMDHTSAIGDLCFSGFPVGSVLGDIVLPTIFLNGYPVVRCFYNWQTVSTSDLFVDYIAAKATYVWSG